MKLKEIDIIKTDHGFVVEAYYEDTEGATECKTWPYPTTDKIFEKIQELLLGEKN